MKKKLILSASMLAVLSLAAKHFYRPRNQAIASKFTTTLPVIPLVTVDKDFGGWTKAQAAHFADGGTFDQIYSGK